MSGKERWRDDEAFVESMLAAKYAARRDADQGVYPHLSEAVTIYMWEMWLAGQAEMRARASAACQTPGTLYDDCDCRNEVDAITLPGDDT